MAGLSRVCGGTTGRDGDTRYRGGLSPRVRGNHDRLEQIIHVPRSIPACAGEPLAPQSGPLLSRVYPRVCGGTND